MIAKKVIISFENVICIKKVHYLLRKYDIFVRVYTFSNCLLGRYDLSVRGYNFSKKNIYLLR